MTQAIFAPTQLDELGRCCGKKPRVYKRPTLYLWCGRCCRVYDPKTGRQTEDSTWIAEPDGNFRNRFYDPNDRERERLGEPLAVIEDEPIPASVRPVRRPVSYCVSGFSCDNHDVRVQMIVDADFLGAGEQPIRIVERIAGPEYCFHAASNLSHPVPDNAKGRLFFSDAELHAAAPELAPKRRRVAR